MNYKIGVFGSAIQEETEAITKAKILGKELALNNCIVITGGGSGMPYIAAYEAAKNGAEVWGFSPNLNKAEQLAVYENDDISIYKKVYYIPKNYLKLFFVTKEDNLFPQEAARKKYRNVVSTANCDAGIIISGRWGTLNEFTNLVDMGKVIGVMIGTGGIADMLESLYRKINKPNNSKVIFNDSPKDLIKQIINELDIIRS